MDNTKLIGSESSKFSVDNVIVTKASRVIEGLSYSLVVGDDRRRGAVPAVGQTVTSGEEPSVQDAEPGMFQVEGNCGDADEVWWNVVRFGANTPELEIDDCPEAEAVTDDEDEVEEPPTPCNSGDEVIDGTDRKPLFIGSQIGWITPESAEENPACGLVLLYQELSSIESTIAMLERFPYEMRPNMADLYLSRLRLRDLINFHTPPPPPVKVEMECEEDSDVESVSDEDLYRGQVEWIMRSAPSNRVPRSRRKRANRAARRRAQEEADRGGDILLRQCIRENEIFGQSGGYIKSYPDSTTAHNVVTLAAKGISNDEIAVFMRGRSFSRYVFSDRTVRRMQRVVIQMRTAHRKMVEAKERLDHKTEKRRRQHSINTAREEKFADTQGFGHIISASLKIAGAVSAVGSLVVASREVTGISKKARGLLDEIKHRIGEFASQLSKLGDALKNTIMAGLLLFLFFKCKHNLIRAALLATIPLVYSGKIKDIILDFFQRENVEPLPETQSGGFDVLDSLPLLMATALLGTLGLSSKAGLKVGMVAALGALPRTITGIETLVDGCVKGTQICLNIVLRWMGRPEVTFRRQLDAKVDAAIKAAHLIDKQMMDPKFENKNSPQMYHTCMNSYAELTTLLSLHHENVKVKQALGPYRAMMATHCGVLRDTLGRGAGFRQEPLSVIIESAPGVGKTMNMPCLIGTVLTGAGLWTNPDPSKLHQAYFCRPANSDYFDGYFGQECYFIDDLFSRKPNLNGMTQFDEVMAFYGTTTVMLNMAALEKKGLYPFTSSLLLMTTNLKCLTQIGADAFLLEPRAFERRVDIHVHIEPLPEYQIKEGRFKGQLDFAKYDAEAKKLAAQGLVGRDSHPWYIWECWDTHFGNTDEGAFPPGTGRSFSEVVDEIIDGLKRKSVNHMDNMEHLSRVLQVPPPVVNESKLAPLPTVSEVDEAIESQAGGKILKDVDSVALKDMPTGSFPRYKDFLDKSSELGLEFTRSGDIEISGKPKVDKNYRVIKLSDDEVESDFGKKMSKRFASYWRSDTLLETVVKSFLTGVATYWAIAIILKPLLNGLMGLVKGAEKVFTGGESQSNERKEKRILRVPGSLVTQQQSPDRSLWRTVYDQTYKMVVDMHDGTSVSSIGQVTFIKQNLAVFPNHFLMQLDKYEADGEIDDKSVLTFYACGDFNRVTMTIKAFKSFPTLPMPGVDLCFKHFKKCFRMHKDITGRVIPEKDLCVVGGREVRLDTATVCSSSGTLLPNAAQVTYNSNTVKLHHTKMRTHTGLSYDRYLSYDANTIPGDCGAPLCLVDYSRFANRCFIGLHVAGQPDTATGFSTPITKEICDKAVQHFKAFELQYTELTPEESLWPEKIKTEPITVVPFTQSGIVGNTRPVCVTSEHVSIPIRSSKVKTDIGKGKVFSDVIRKMNEGREPPVLAPMRLGKYVDKETGEMVYPMKNALDPYIDKVFVAEDGSFKAGLSAGLKAFADTSRNYDSPVLTTQEAILGVPALSLKSITRSTSVGYPLGTFARDKKYFFGSDTDMRVDTPEAIELISNIERLEEMLKEGKRPFFVCRDFLKDEVRKVGKNARLIAGTDLSYYILCRKYFGAYVGAVTRSHKKSGICLGINPYSQWGDLRTMLEKPDPTGNNVWDGDFAGFDSSQAPQLLWDCLEYINNWYMIKAMTSEERARVTVDNRVRTILFLDLVYSKHITSFDGPANTIIEWCKSLPSGHFLTSTINSMLSLGLVAAGYVALTGETNFWETSAAVVLGDDNVVSTSDAYVGVFNQVTLAKYLLSTFGMVYTAGRKGEDLKPTIGIDNVVFLQRRFAVKNGLDVCPIRPESFLHSLYYVHTNDPKVSKDTLLAGIELAFEELSMHDEDYWSEVAILLIEEKRKLGHTPEANVNTSEDYFWRVRSRVPSYI